MDFCERMNIKSGGLSPTKKTLTIRYCIGYDGSHLGGLKDREKSTAP